MAKKFINRTDDFGFIVEKYYEFVRSEKSFVLILYGDKFIGKSRLVSEVISYLDINRRTFFHLKTTKHNILKAENGYFFHVFSTAINAQFKKEKWFLYAIKNLVRFIRKNVNVIASIILKMFSLNILGEAANAIINIQSYNDFYNVYSYARKHQLIVHVENTHIIDDISLKWFIKLLQQNGRKKMFIVFEYTSKKDHTNVEEFTDCYRKIKDVSVNKYFLQPLAFEHCKLLIDFDFIDERTESLFQKVVHNANGNIYRITEFKLEKIDRFKLSDNYNSVLDELTQLSTNELIILFIIFQHGCSITYSTLKSLIEYNQHFHYLGIDISTINVILNTLTSKNFVFSTDNKVNLSREQIIEEIKSIIKNKKLYQIQLIAFNLLREPYYFDLTNNSILFDNRSNYDSLMLLIRIYSIYDIQSICSISDLIIGHYLSNNNYFQKINIIVSLCELNYENVQNHSYITEFLLKESYNIGLLNAFKKILGSIYNENNFAHNLYQIQKFIIFNEFDKQKEKVSAIVEKYKKDEQKSAIIEMTIFDYYVSKKDLKIDKYASRIITKKKIALQYYALFLRCYTNVLPLKDSIKHLNESIAILDQFGNTKEKYQSFIALARTLIYSGRLHEAKELLHEADKNMSNIAYKKYYYFNNLAIIDIMLGKVTKKTELYLMKARNMANYLYEEIIIANNLFCYHCRKKSFEQALFYYEYIINNIENKKHSSWFLIRIYFNFYKFNKMQSTFEIKNIEYEIKKLTTYKDYRTKEVTEICNHILQNAPIPFDSPFYFMCSKGFIVGTLCDWSYDIASLIGSKFIQN